MLRLETGLVWHLQGPGAGSPGRAWPQGALVSCGTAPRGPPVPSSIPHLEDGDLYAGGSPRGASGRCLPQRGVWSAQEEQGEGTNPEPTEHGVRGLSLAAPGDDGSAHGKTLAGWGLRLHTRGKGLRSHSPLTHSLLGVWLGAGLTLSVPSPQPGPVLRGVGGEGPGQGSGIEWV